jgi:hypothetical protein
MATLTQIIGYLYSAEGTVLTQGVLSMRLQQDIVSVDGTKVAPTLISQDLSTSAGLFNKSVYATVGASPAGVAYFVEFDPDPTNVDVPPNQKEGYWFNYWSVPNTSSVALGSFLTAHRGEPYINYMPLGGGGGTVGGSGTTGYIPIWASGSSLSNSLLQQSGSVLTMTGQFRASGAFAIYDFYESDQGVDGKFWRWIADGGQLMLQSVNDAYNSASTLVTFSRAGGLTLTVPLAVGSGGTGRSSWTTGDLVYASSSSASVASGSSRRGPGISLWDHACVERHPNTDWANACQPDIYRRVCLERRDDQPRGTAQRHQRARCPYLRDVHRRQQLSAVRDYYVWLHHVRHRFVFRWNRWDRRDPWIRNKQHPQVAD